MKLFVIVLTISIAGAALNYEWKEKKLPLELPEFYTVTQHAVTDALVKHREGRIIGGEEASKNQFPYQVALFLNRVDSVHFCSGSIIDFNWILTAAHCLEKVLNVEVYVGIDNILIGPAWWYRLVDRRDFIIHEAYNTFTTVNDIALIRLTTNIPAAPTAAILKLIPRSLAANLFTGRPAIASGYGRYSDHPDTDISPVLRFVHTQISSIDTCISHYSSFFVRDTHICATTAICSGDSGGPLVLTDDGVKYQVGISSFGANKCEGNHLDVYTRVGSYLKWIEQQTNLGLK